MGPTMKPVTIALTMGDPAGVGPELVWRLSAGFRWAGAARVVVIGDGGALGAGRAATGAGGAVGEPGGAGGAGGAVAAGAAGAAGGALGPAFEFLDLANVRQHRWGQVRAEYGAAAREYIETAVAMALDGRADAVVTCPINKESLAASGSPYPGHTEMLAALTGAPRVGMCLVGGGLRVTLATRHVPIAGVPAALTKRAVLDAIELTHEAGADFGCPSPRIAVCGLNPHAGDGGVLGTEEGAVIRPAIEAARAEGIEASGPYPADTVFVAARRGDFDFVVPMYHDQGLVPLKLLGFEEGVNVTLGLPIVRTSVDHGTAFDIAGTGAAGAGSLMAAFELALSMAARRRGE